MNKLSRQSAGQDYESDPDQFTDESIEDFEDDDDLSDYEEPVEPDDLPAPNKKFFEQRLKQPLPKPANDAPLLPPPRGGSKSLILTDQPPAVTRRTPKTVTQPPKRNVEPPQKPQGRPLPNPPTNPKDRALPPVPTSSKIANRKAPDPPNRSNHPSRNAENQSPKQSAIPPRSRNTGQPPLRKQPDLPPRNTTPPVKQPSKGPVPPKRGRNTPSLRSISSASSEGDLSGDEPLDDYVEPELIPEDDEDRGQSGEDLWNKKKSSACPESAVPVLGIDTLTEALKKLKTVTPNQQNERSSVKPSENVSPIILKPFKNSKTPTSTKVPPIIGTLHSSPTSPLTPVSPSTSVGSDESSEISSPSIRAPVPPEPTSVRPPVKIPNTTTGKTPKTSSEKSSTTKNSKPKRAFVGPPKTNDKVSDNRDVKSRPLPSTPDKPELPLALRDRGGSIDKQIEMLPVQPPEPKRVKEVKDFDWYYGNIARPQAENYLTNKKCGVFLIRKNMKGSNRECPYILSIMFGTRVWHLQLRLRQDEQYAIGSYKSNEKAYSSVPELIEYFKSNMLDLNGSNGGEVKLLTHPRDKSLEDTGKRDPNMS